MFAVAGYLTVVCSAFQILNFAIVLNLGIYSICILG